MAQQGTIEYIGRIQLDASELMKVLGMAPSGAVTGAGGGGGVASGASEEQAKTIQKGMRKSYKDPSFMSIFKPLVALEGLKSLVANSRVANAYLGGMGKMFSAAIDMLLLPFTPLFSLLMVGLSKLIGWLIDSGVLEAIEEGVQMLIDLFGGVAKWVAEMAKAIVNFDISKIGELLVDAVREIGKLIIDFFKHPLESLKNLGKMALAAGGILGMGAMMPGPIGGLARGAIGGGLGLLGGMFGFGKGKAPAPPVTPPMVGGGGGGAGGMFARGGMGRMLGGGALLGGGMMLGQATGSSILGGAGMGAGVGMMMGGPGGALAGAGIGAGIGLLDEKLLGGKLGGMLGFGGGKGGGGGGKMADKIQNIGTQNITMNVKVEDPKHVKELMKQFDEQTTNSAIEG